MQKTPKPVRVVNGKTFLLIPNPNQHPLTPESPYFTPCQTDADIQMVKEQLCYASRYLLDDFKIIGYYDFHPLVIVETKDKDGNILWLIEGEGRDRTDFVKSAEITEEKGRFDVQAHEYNLQDFNIRRAQSEEIRAKKVEAEKKAWAQYLAERIYEQEADLQPIIAKVEALAMVGQPTEKYKDELAPLNELYADYRKATGIEFKCENHPNPTQA